MLVVNTKPLITILDEVSLETYWNYVAKCSFYIHTLMLKVQEFIYVSFTKDDSVN